MVPGMDLKVLTSEEKKDLSITCLLDDLQIEYVRSKNIQHNSTGKKRQHFFIVKKLERVTREDINRSWREGSVVKWNQVET